MLPVESWSHSLCLAPASLRADACVQELAGEFGRRGLPLALLPLPAASGQAAVGSAASEHARRAAMQSLQQSTSGVDSQRATTAPIGWGACLAMLRAEVLPAVDCEFSLAAQTSAATAVATWLLPQREVERHSAAVWRELLSELLLAIGSPARARGSAASASIAGEAPGVLFEQIVAQANAGWQALRAGQTSAVDVLGAALAADPARGAAPRLVFPGSFWPRHRGHRRMAEVAAARTGQACAHEISIANVDKPWLDFLDMADRAAQFEAQETLWFTAAATFAEKAALFPGATFVVGADTLARIADPQYYAAGTAGMHAALAAIAAQGCRFLVFGRETGERFAHLDTLSLPDELRALSDAVSAAEFSDPISSTRLRQER